MLTKKLRKNLSFLSLYKNIFFVNYPYAHIKIPTDKLPTFVSNIIRNMKNIKK